MKFKTLLSVEEAKSFISELKFNVRVVEVPVYEAVGRYAAEDVYAPVDIPPFPRSIRDGFAVRSQDVVEADERNPVVLRVRGVIEAGQVPEIEINRGECLEIATGAVMPPGSDAVVMVEYTERRGNEVLIKRAVRSGENVMGRASDIPMGHRVVRKGDKLDFTKVGVLSALGFETVKISTLHIGVISTGDELVEPGKELPYGKIYDVNGNAIAAYLKSAGFDVVGYGIVGDDEKEMRDTVRKAVQECDVVVTSGSTSMGQKDLLPRIIGKEGRIVFHGVQVKPGKPFLVAEVSGKPFFGLPGFPVSALTILHEFVFPTLLKAVNGRITVKKMKGRLATRYVGEGRHEFVPVFMVRDKIFPIEKGSGAITALSDACGYMEVRSGEEVLERGEEREVTFFKDKSYSLIVGGIDIFELVNEVDAGYADEVKTVPMPAARAKAEFMKGALDVAVILKDGEDLAYGIASMEGKGNKGKIGGWQKGYGLPEGDVSCSSHLQLYYLFKTGAIDGFYCLEPFVKLFNLSFKESGRVGVEILSNEEGRHFAKKLRELLSSQESAGSDNQSNEGNKGN
jgi:molybdenum cofactor synthesis domain-containing protein